MGKQLQRRENEVWITALDTVLSVVQSSLRKAAGNPGGLAAFARPAPIFTRAYLQAHVEMHAHPLTRTRTRYTRSNTSLGLHGSQHTSWILKHHIPTKLTSGSRKWPGGRYADHMQICLPHPGLSTGLGLRHGLQVSLFKGPSSWGHPDALSPKTHAVTGMAQPCLRSGYPLVTWALSSPQRG